MSIWGYKKVVLPVRTAAQGSGIAKKVLESSLEIFKE